MSIPRLCIALLLTGTCLVGSSFAQTSTLTYASSYEIKVLYWNHQVMSGEWVTEFETTDPVEARLMYEMFVMTWEEGELARLMGYGFGWQVKDVVLKTNYQLIQPATTSWRTRISSYR